jgi:3-dehydroquinate dehydratase-1
LKNKLKTNRRDKICVSLIPRNISDLQKKIDKADCFKPELIEVRTDYLDNWNISILKECIKVNLEKCILTCRSEKQEGFFRGQEKDRIKIIEKLVEIQPAFIDLEIETLKEKNYLIKTALKNNVKIIVSWHDFSNTPSLSKLKTIFGESRELGDLVKIVPTAKKILDNLKIFKLYEEAKKGKLISFCMGIKGFLSRILCTRLGAPFTYAALDEKTGAGQISIWEMRKFYDAI